MRTEWEGAFLAAGVWDYHTGQCAPARAEPSPTRIPPTSHFPPSPGLLWIPSYVFSTVQGPPCFVDTDDALIIAGVQMGGPWPSWLRERLGAGTIDLYLAHINLAQERAIRPLLRLARLALLRLSPITSSPSIVL